MRLTMLVHDDHSFAAWSWQNVPQQEPMKEASLVCKDGKEFLRLDSFVVADRLSSAYPDFWRLAKHASFK